MRILGIIVTILLWLLLGWKMYTDWNECCANTTPVEETTAIVENVHKAGPLEFNWSDKTPLFGDGWAAYSDSIISNLSDNQKLNITGLYRSDEENKTGFDDLGLARADSVKQVLSARLDPDRISTSSRLISEGDGDRDHSFISANFAHRIISDKIKELDDRTEIYFPYNSTNKLNDREVEAYLDDVIDRLKNTSEKVMLIGHTDNTGPAESNMELGQARADIIKKYLVANGLPSAKVSTSSKGETSPIADNTTRDGRAENRRTTLRIIK